jgi:hypothetical protein
MYIGTDKAKIYQYSIENQKGESEPFELDDSAAAVDLIYCINGLSDADYFICNVSGKGIRCINFKERKSEKIELEKDFNGEVA